MTKLEEYLNKYEVITGTLDTNFALQVTRDCYIGTQLRLKEAIKAYVEFCCKEQKKICVKKARIENNNGLRKDHFTTEDGQHFIIVKDSILNCPTYKEEYGK